MSTLSRRPRSAKVPSNPVALDAQSRLRAYRDVARDRNGEVQKPWDRESVILLPGDPLADLNPNSLSGGWGRSAPGTRAKEARLAREWKMRSWIAWKESGAPVYTVRVSIHPVIYRGRVIDGDNAVAALKHVLDGLTVVGTRREAMLPSDSAEWLSLREPTLITGKRFRFGPLVLFVVSPDPTEER